jgi:hypothetical protein
VEIVVAPAQLRGSCGFFGSVSGLLVQLPPPPVPDPDSPVLPAAATTTMSLSIAA